MTPSRRHLAARAALTSLMGMTGLTGWPGLPGLTSLNGLAALTAGLTILAAAPPLQAQGSPDARERAFIRKGMHEAEVLWRIGKPDHEAMVRNERGQPEEKTWSYFPHPRDPQTLTILTLRAGVVAEIERKITR